MLPARGNLRGTLRADAGLLGHALRHHVQEDVPQAPGKRCAVGGAGRVDHRREPRGGVLPAGARRVRLRRGPGDRQAVLDSAAPFPQHQFTAVLQAAEPVDGGVSAQPEPGTAPGDLAQVVADGQFAGDVEDLVGGGHLGVPEVRVGAVHPSLLDDRRGRAVLQGVPHDLQGLVEASGADEPQPQPVRGGHAALDLLGAPGAYEAAELLEHRGPLVGVGLGEQVGEELALVALEVAAQQPVPLRPRLDLPGEQVEHGPQEGEPPQRPVGAGGVVAAVVPPDGVVAVVVGHHRDHRGVEVGGGGERLVLPHGEAGVEAEPEVFEERPAEEFRRPQRPVDVGVEHGGPRLVAAEHGEGHGPSADPDHLAEDHVGAVGVGRGDHAFQCLGAEPVVGVQEEHVAAGGQVQADVARLGGAARVLLVDHPHGRAPCGEAVEFLAGAVGGPVVDRDDLQPFGADRLLEDGLDALDQVGHRVVGGDDDTDVGWGGHVGSGGSVGDGAP